MGDRDAAADPHQVAEQLRAVLATVDAGELPCSAAYRNRLEGAVVHRLRPGVHS